MPKLTLQYDGKTAGRTLERNMQKNQGAVKSAMRSAAEDAAALILQRGRADITGAGNYSARWTEGLHAQVTGNEESDKIIVNVTHSLSFFPFFLKGGVIKGRPWLWLPLSFKDVARGVTPSQMGDLFRVNRKAGEPLLMSRTDRKPKFIGKTQVSIKQKFHTREIIREVVTSGELARFYKDRFDQQKVSARG